MYCLHIHIYAQMYTGTCVCVEVRGQSQVIFSPSLYLIYFFFWNTVSQWIWSLTIDQAGWPEGSRYLLISMCSNVGNIGACCYPSFSYGCWWSKLGFSHLRRKLFIDLAISPAPNTRIFSHLLLCVVKVSLEHCFGIWAVLEYLGKMNCLHTNGINYRPTSVCKY